MKLGQLFIVASVLVLAISCTKNETDPGYLPVPLSIVPMMNKDETTITHLDSYIELYQFGIQVTNPSGTELYTPNLKSVKLFKSDTWVLSPPVPIYCPKAKIYGYSPYSAIESDLTGIGERAQLLLDIPKSQVMREQIDYLYASQDKTLPQGTNDIFYWYPNVTLAFNHALALVSIKINKGNYNGAGVLTQLEIKDNSALSNLTANTSGNNNLKMNLANGAVTGGEAATFIAITGIGNTITESAQIYCYAYVVPATFDNMSNVQFILTIDNQLFTTSLQTTEILTWAKGKQYIYEIELSTTSFTIIGVTISDWATKHGDHVIIK